MRIQRAVGLGVSLGALFMITVLTSLPLASADVNGSPGLAIPVSGTSFPETDYSEFGCGTASIYWSGLLYLPSNYFEWSWTTFANWTDTCYPLDGTPGVEGLGCAFYLQWISWEGPGYGSGSGESVVSAYVLADYYTPSCANNGGGSVNLVDSVMPIAQIAI